MRKRLSLILATILLLTMVPYSTLAVEDTSGRDELLALGCEVFPEYTDKIMSPNVTLSLGRSSTSNTREVVKSEVRAVSETENLTYTEYSDGLVLLTSVEFPVTVTTIDSETSSFSSNYTITIKATCSEASGYFQLSNVKYSIIRSAYDTITSEGTKSSSGKCWESSDGYYFNATETSSKKAFISYRLCWQFADYPGYVYNSLLTLEVGQNSASVTHVNDT